MLKPHSRQKVSTRDLQFVGSTDNSKNIETLLLPISSLIKDMRPIPGSDIICVSSSSLSIKCIIKTTKYNKVKLKITYYPEKAIKPEMTQMLLITQGYKNN